MKSNNHFVYKSATELLSDLSRRKISSKELLEATISRIEIYDKKINAIPIRDFEHAFELADQADQKIAKGEKLPLLGLPITVKESFNVLGMKTTWGNPQFKNWMPEEDSLVISRLKAAGAIIIGKTNVPFMLADWQSFNDIYGTTNNPFDLTKSPGGSSGGSAAALAAGFVSLELGSDLAGSLRVPANFCGVYTHKPTFGVIPLRGVSPPNAPVPGHIDFVTVGPMARTMDDIALEFNILAGPDPLLEGRGFQLSLPSSRKVKLNEFRVLVLDQHPLCPTSDEVSQSFAALSQRLIKAGVKVSNFSSNLPDLSEIAKTYEMLLAAFLNLGITKEVYEQYKKAARALQPNDTSLKACHIRGVLLSHYEWLLISRTRTELFQKWRELYKEFDVIICPVMPTPAFPHNHSDPLKREIKINDQMISYWYQKIWISIATLFRLPATVIPIDRTKSELPIGIQIIGDYLEDKTTIQFAKVFEEEFGGFQPPQLSKER